LPRAAAFWLVAGVLFLLFFAAYAVLLLTTLLVFGPASDFLAAAG
jgi:hypothetical protein